jgi:hypothetical protein
LGINIVQCCGIVSALSYFVEFDMRFAVAYLACSVVALCVSASAASAAENSGPRQRVVISDDYTSWLLKGEGTERYGDGEALPRLLAEGWSIASVTAGCDVKGRTIYVLRAPLEAAKK